MTDKDLDRRRLLRRTAGATAAVGALAIGGALGFDDPAAEGGRPSADHPVVGTWRGLDIDGTETGRGPVTATATRFGLEPF